MNNQSSNSISNSQSNSDVIAQYVDAFNRGDIDKLRSIFTEDGLVYGALGWGKPDEVAPIWKMLHDSLSMELTVEEIIAEGDNVVVRFVERGKSVAPFRGQEPTGKSSEVIAIEWFVFRDGRIARRWGVRDSISHFRQMGLSMG